MKSLPKPLVIAILAIIILTTGSLVLIRSCFFGKAGKGFGGAPAGMREQYAISPALYPEKDGKSVVFTIVQHLKILSYSRRGNMVTRSASTTYYVQTNDAHTAEKLAELKVKTNSDIKNYPVEVMGVSGPVAWVFIGEPMAFNAFSLEKLADTRILEEKNKMLTGKFPGERKYYRFSPETASIYFTALDGTKWKLDTRSLLATRIDDGLAENPYEAELAGLEIAEKKNRDDYDTLYRYQNLVPSQEYAQGKISQAEYNRMSKAYYVKRELLDRTRDSLRRRKHQLWDLQRHGREMETILEKIRSGSSGYSDMKTNDDTINGQWFGLLGTPEFGKRNTRLEFRSETDETTRRQLYQSAYRISNTGAYEIDKPGVMIPGGQTGFLHGGFLLDDQTGSAIHLPGPSFLIIHRNQVGREALILVSLTDTGGKTVWTCNTLLKEWAAWHCNGKQLLVLGTSNPDLSSGQINLLISIDLLTGKASRFDYYLDEKLKAD